MQSLGSPPAVAYLWMNCVPLKFVCGCPHPSASSVTFGLWLSAGVLIKGKIWRQEHAHRERAVEVKTDHCQAVCTRERCTLPASSWSRQQPVPTVGKEVLLCGLPAPAGRALQETPVPGFLGHLVSGEGLPKDAGHVPAENRTDPGTLCKESLE